MFTDLIRKQSLSVISIFPSFHKVKFAQRFPALAYSDLENGSIASQKKRTKSTSKYNVTLLENNKVPGRGTVIIER